MRIIKVERGNLTSCTEQTLTNWTSLKTVSVKTGTRNKILLKEIFVHGSVHFANL